MAKWQALPFGLRAKPTFSTPCVLTTWPKRIDPDDRKRGGKMDNNYLKQTVPTAEVLLNLEPEELGAFIVVAMQRGRDRLGHPGSVLTAFYPNHQPYESEGYPQARKQEVEGAVFEAWSWLEGQGLLIWSDFANGGNGYRRLSRRAQQLDIAAIEDFAAARALPREIIHDAIKTRVWSDFVRGHYDSAVLFAARQVEISVRNAAAAGDDRYDVPLMRDAFHPDTGPLTDENALRSEREARMNLFCGFIGHYKNPLSHRDIDMDDPFEAIEVILMASHLLRIVDGRIAG